MTAKKFKKKKLSRKKAKPVKKKAKAKEKVKPVKKKAKAKAKPAAKKKAKAKAKPVKAKAKPAAKKKAKAKAKPAARKKKPRKKVTPSKKIPMTEAPSYIAYIALRLRAGIRAWQERLRLDGWDSQSRTHVNADDSIDSQIDFYFPRPPKTMTVAALAFDAQKASKIPIMNKKLDRDLYMAAGFVGIHSGGAFDYKKNSKGEFSTWPMHYGLGNTTFITIREKLLVLVKSVKLERFFVRLHWSREEPPKRKKKNR